MKRYIVLLIMMLVFISCNKAAAVTDEYNLVAQLSNENITLYAKKMGGVYGDFKLDFKGTIYARPFWISVSNNPTYAPQIIYEDINKDKHNELVIILNKGYGTGVLLEEVYVFDTHPTRFGEVLVDSPLAIVYKNVKTKLSTDKAEITIGNKTLTIDITSLEIQSANIFMDISFGSIIKYEVQDGKLIARVAGQISPASFVGEIVITYEFRDNMYQAKSIQFEPYL